MVSSISISILFRQLLFLPRFLLLAKVPRHCQGEEGDDNGRNNESGPEVQFEATDDVSLVWERLHPLGNFRDEVLHAGCLCTLVQLQDFLQGGACGIGFLSQLNSLQSNEIAMFSS